MSKLEVDKIDPQSGTDLELGTSGDTITIPTGVTLDASNATTTLPANVVTTDGTQTLTNKSIDASQLTGTITPSDGTVTNAKIVDSTIQLAKLSATGTKDATTFLRGDNTFAEAGGGKLLQVVTATDDTQRDTTSTSFVTASNTLSVSITPASSSNKVFINVTGAHLGSNSAFYTIYRDATNLGSSNGLSMMNNGATTGAMGFGMSVLDSPSSTSAITYQVYLKASSGQTARINNSSVRGTITAFEIAG